MDPRNTRRGVLEAAGALLVAGSLAGCSSDGLGSDWRLVDPPAEEVGVYDLAFLDGTTGWAAVGVDDFGNDGGFYRTDDGGESWTRKRPEDGRVVSVADEGDRLYGFGNAGGGDFFSWYSDDGGENWSPIANDAYGVPETFGDAAFFTDEVGFATSRTGRYIQWTTDGGENFERYDLEDCSINDLAAVGDDVWIVGNGDADEPNEGGCLLHSTARGEPGTWTLERFTDEAHDFAGGALNGIYTPDGEELWVAGQNRQLYYSTDGGGTWTQVDGLDDRISSFVAVDGHDDHLLLAGLDQGSATGQDGLIYESTDGGDTWELAWEPGEGETASFDGLEFVAADLAYAYSTSGDVLRYTG